MRSRAVAVVASRRSFLHRVLTGTLPAKAAGMVAAFLAMITAGAASAWAGAAEGKAVYEKQCKTCHSVAGEGGKMASTGGALDGVGPKRAEA